MPGLLPSRLVATRERWRSVFHAVLETRQLVADARSDLSAQMEATSSAQHAESALLGALRVQWEASSSAQHAESARLREILRSIAGREPLQRERLRELRGSERYLAAFVEPEPLVSVVIPTYDNTVLLRERAICSVLAQTYQHFEVVVVGDGVR